MVAADYGYSVYGIEMSPEIESYGRRIAHGDYSHDVSISGRRTGEVKVSCDLYDNATATCPPRYFTLIRACGLTQTVGANGVYLDTTSTANRAPGTIEVVEPQEGDTPQQLVYRFFGCMGNATLACDSVGKPFRIDFAFKGAFGGVSTRAYASMLTPTSFDDRKPAAVLAATLNLFGTTLFIGKISIDLGNDVQVYDEATMAGGVSGARVVDRRSTMECDPDMLVTSDFDWYTNQISNTPGALSVTVGDKMSISAPKAQVVDSYKPGDRQGHTTNALKLELQRNSGNDELRILQGSAA